MKINSIFNTEFLTALVPLSLEAGKAALLALLALLADHAIKVTDANKIKVGLLRIKSRDELLIYAYNLNLKYEGFGVQK